MAHRRKSRSQKRSSKRRSSKRTSRSKRVSRKTHGKKTQGGYASVYKGHAKHTVGGVRKSGIMKRKVGGEVRYVSKKKHSAAKKNKGIGNWTKALKMHGYFKKGSFKPAPKKGTAEYRKVRATYDSMK